MRKTVEAPGRLDDGILLGGVTGVAPALYVPQQPIVALRLAATLKAYRGQGIYRSLIARRLADAHADGAKVAIMQAVRNTSAPICAKLGFRELCNLDVYEWHPQNTFQKDKNPCIK